MLIYATIRFTEPGEYEVKGNETYVWTTGGLLPVPKMGERYQKLYYTVVDRVVAGTIAPEAQTIAYGATPALLRSTVGASGGQRAVTYQWQSSPDGQASSWTNITNAKSATYQSPALTSTTYFRRQATDGSMTVYSNVVTVVVGQPLQGGTIGTDDPTFAYGSTPLLTNINPASGGIGKITYKWQISILYIDRKYIDIVNSNSLSYQLPILTAKAYYRRVAIDETGDIAYSNEIYARASLNGEALSPPTQFLTDNTLPSMLYSTLPSSAGQGTPTYRWFKRTFNDTETIFSEWEEIPYATSREYQPPLLPQNTNFRLETNYEDEKFYQEANVYVVPEPLIRTPIITSDKTSAIYPEYIMCWTDEHYISDDIEIIFDWYCNGVRKSGSSNGYFRVPPDLSGTVSVTCRARRLRNNAALSEMSNAIIVNVTSW